MRKTASFWIVGLVIGLMVLSVGCPGSGEKPNDPDTGESPVDPGGRVDPGGIGEVDPRVIPPGNGNGGGEPAEAGPGELPVDASIPEVRLPEMLTATCLVGVGDQMPDAPLDVLGGGQAPLRSQFGPRLTVMLFWTSNNLYACDELRDLTGDLAEPYADDGLRVIGINVSDSAEAAAEAVDAAEAGFPNFLDPKGEYFAKVATEKLPRTYLLGADGKILWFDLEYSLTTRRQLDRAVKAALGSEAAQPPDGGTTPPDPVEAPEEEPKPAEDETPVPEAEGDAEKPAEEKPGDEKPATEGDAVEGDAKQPAADADADPGEGESSAEGDTPPAPADE